MSEPIRVRCVGGVYHNKFPVVREPLPYLRVPVPLPFSMRAIGDDGPVEYEPMQIQEYQLTVQTAESGTKFLEYHTDAPIPHKPPQRRPLTHEEANRMAWLALTLAERIRISIRPA